MLADQAAGVLAVRSGLVAEAGSIRRIANRQIGFSEDFIPVDIGDRNFRSRNQEKINIFCMKKIVFKLGELSGPRHGVSVYHKGRKRFNVIMLGCMQVEHEVNQRPFQPGTGPLEQGKTGAGELASSFKIEDVEVLADIPVSLRLKSEIRNFTPGADFDVFLFTRADRTLRVGQVRNDQHPAFQVVFKLTQLFIDPLDASRHILHPGNFILHRTLVLGFANQGRDLVALRLERFTFAEEFTTTDIEIPEPGKIGVLAPGLEPGDNRVDIFTQQFAVEHDKTSCL